MSPILAILLTFAFSGTPLALNRRGLAFLRFDWQDLAILALSPALPFLIWGLA